MIGVLTGIKRKGKEFNVRHPAYRLYSFLWTALFPLRLSVFRAKRRARRLLRRTGLTPLVKRLLRRK
ncbi:MAG: hypothetical protein IJT95_02155 [Abditibacteriota bacterium]|nr:hypothetical protein [Abditibacteriota bacterium]